MEHEPGEVGNPAKSIIAILQEENEGHWTRKQCEEEGRMYMRDTAERTISPERRTGRQERRKCGKIQRILHQKRGPGRGPGALHVPAFVCVQGACACGSVRVRVCVIFEFISVFSFAFIFGCTGSFLLHTDFL